MDAEVATKPRKKRITGVGNAQSNRNVRTSMIHPGDIFAELRASRLVQTQKDYSGYWSTMQGQTKRHGVSSKGFTKSLEDLLARGYSPAITKFLAVALPRLALESATEGLKSITRVDAVALLEPPRRSYSVALGI